VFQLSDAPPGALMAEATLQAAGDALQGQRLAEPAPASPAPSTQAEPARGIALQVVAAVLSDGEGGFELQLAPEELGKVRLSLQVSDGVAVLAIHAERPETIDLMRRHVDVLEREFRDAGFASLTFTFGQGSPDSRTPASPAYAEAIRDRAADPVPATAFLPRTGSRSSSQLDLRL
jgi:hypothetical protein